MTQAASTALITPVQCRNLEDRKQGEGWVFLDWKEPLDLNHPVVPAIALA